MSNGDSIYEKVRNTFWVLHLHAAYFVAAVYVGGWYHAWAGLGFGHISIVCVTVYLHRSQTHRAVRLHWLVSIPMRLWLWLTTGIDTRQWVATHRKHHADVEGEDDPHSPVLDYQEIRRLSGGWIDVFWFEVRWNYYLGFQRYRQACKDSKIIEQYGHGTPSGRFESFLRFTKNWIWIVGLLLLVQLFGVMSGLLTLLYMGLLMIVYSAGVINGLGHSSKESTIHLGIPDHSKNVFPVGLLIGGEENHKNHHADSASAKFSREWYEFDVGWFWICILRGLFLAKLRERKPADV
jgi:stearoyl-CoA desaturase (delta-9 desaturase)